MKTKSSCTNDIGHKCFRLPGKLFFSLIAAAAAGLSPPSAVLADDSNMAAASCFAPFLDQAFPMRWHEHFLMNPTTGVTTFVICPINFDNDEWGNTTSISSVRVNGGIMAGADPSDPLCFFTVNSGTNLNQPPFITGTDQTFTVSMPISRNGSNWNARLSNVQISAINAGAGNDKNAWAAAFFCKLPTGYSVSQTNVILPN
jgi:hypothetical protein